MKISIIEAMARNRVIGKDGKIPWHLPADIRWFRKHTLGHPVVMGRKTFESIGCGLEKRFNIVVSRQPNYEAKDCLVVQSLEDALYILEDNDEEIFIIGGAELFRQG